jgi:hypothetical protein
MAAGYSGTPQSTKLGIKPGLRVCLDQAPDDWSLSDPPDGMILVGLSGPVDIVVSFFRTAAELPTRLPTLARLVFPAGALWVAWPRRAGGHRSDITDNVVREHALPLGLVDVKIAAIDDDWSAQRLVWRREARSGP